MSQMHSRNPDIFFNAQHAPIGAFASFTLGFPGRSGGLGIELSGPAGQNVFVGLESREGGRFDALPFFADSNDERKRFDVQQEAPSDETNPSAGLHRFDAEHIRRAFRLATDTWTAGDLRFRILSPVLSVPDPERASPEEVKEALMPAVHVEFAVDNTAGRLPRRAFFGYEGNDPYTRMRRLDDTADGRFVGVGQGRIAAIVSRDKGVRSGLGFCAGEILQPAVEDNLTGGLGPVGLLIMDVPAGERRAWRFAVCFFRGGLATAGVDARYFYTRYFSCLEDVAAYALDRFDRRSAQAAEADALLENAGLSDDRAFMLAHAVHSYYGSTELLELENRPFWIVNEGEYRMMNTFDLTVDQLFFEMRMNPWTVRNELDMFVRRYSYTDRVRFPGDATEHPGGISFTHDMGVANSLSRPGHSSYELFGLRGCFSHMTHEQLVNWVNCAGVYHARTSDDAWLERNAQVVEACLESMLHRDHPDPARRNGVMSLDSSRTRGGAEITTYDSLDESLGQARNNLYMAVKCWSAYVLLERLLNRLHRADPATVAGQQANRCAETLVGHVGRDGYIPALLGERNDSRIIPAVEGLVFPWMGGCREALDPEGRFGNLLAALRRHLETILQPGVCLFADGGWKLSSTSDNSWLSKIYLCQFVAHRILGLPADDASRTADRAHRQWLLRAENAPFAWSDQMVNGTARGSRYYPRGVTGILWLPEDGLEQGR